MVSGGPVHERVKGNANLILTGFVAIHGLKVLCQSETRYYLQNDFDIFQPDVSLVLGDSLDPKDVGKITIAPDLAVEVVSSEKAERLNHKKRALLELGARAVVVIYPADKEILIHRANRIERLTVSGTLQLEDVLPGFAVPVADFFQGV